MYEIFLKCDVTCPWTPPLSQTVTPSRTPSSVTYFMDGPQSQHGGTIQISAVEGLIGSKFWEVIGERRRDYSDWGTKHRESGSPCSNEAQSLLSYLVPEGSSIPWVKRLY